MKDPELTPEESLRADNEIEAMKLNLEFGAQSFISEDAPPDVVKAFLDNVKQFEAAHKDAKIVSIAEFIGNPIIPDVKGMSEEEIEIILENFQNILLEKQVHIDHPEHLSPIGYFKFLTEEFFKHEITDYSNPMMMHGFIYSEFRHDGPEFIEEHAQDAVEDILFFKRPYQAMWLTEECRSAKTLISKQDVIKKVEAFRAKYVDIIPLGFQKEELIPRMPFMYFTFGVAYEGVFADGTKEKHEGMGICQLIFEDEEWMVQGIQMPGFEF